MERLQKILSRAGVASRRAAEKLMLEGRITVNGTTVRELGTKADATRDDIRVDGRRIRPAERHRYLLLNKPRGYVSTRSDPQRRPTILDLVGVREYVYPVGRLDFESEGLLILTNDGDLAARLTHPRHGLARVYEVQVAGVPDEHDLQRLARGVVIDGRRTEPAEVVLLPSARVYARARDPEARGGGLPSPRLRRVRRSSLDRTRAEAEAPRASKDVGRATLRLTIREGRNRQVRKMCDAIGHPVDHLKRVAIGPIRDKQLKPGEWRELTAEEVSQLQAAAGAARTQRTQGTQRKNH
jgi:pseudouridine synthase